MLRIDSYLPRFDGACFSKEKMVFTLPCGPLDNTGGLFHVQTSFTVFSAFFHKPVTACTHLSCILNASEEMIYCTASGGVDGIPDHRTAD